MKTALLHEDRDLRTFVLVLGTGDETIRALASFAAENRLKASQFSAIGAFERAVVAYFEWGAKQYRNIAIDEQVEVLSMSGDITLENQSPKVQGSRGHPQRRSQKRGRGSAGASACAQHEWCG
jgi:predicted DNA-binding protein with PD1-like motif